jgi:hypothetical protein
MSNTKIALFAVLLSLAIAMPACRSTAVYRKADSPEVVAKKAGPPPHAPAHGYRHKHREGIELVYNAEIGVYLVMGHDHCYFYKDSFYRLTNGSWQVSVEIGGKWRAIPDKKVPPGLQKKYAYHKAK